MLNSRKKYNKPDLLGLLDDGFSRIHFEDLGGGESGGANIRTSDKPGDIPIGEGEEVEEP